MRCRPSARIDWDIDENGHFSLHFSPLFRAAYKMGIEIEKWTRK